MKPDIAEIPEKTREIAEACFPKGNKYVLLRKEYGPLYIDENFADLYSWKGEEGLSGALLATVTILQFAEGLTDREAAEHVRSRIDWKYLLGVEVTYAGFHYSVLSEFRKRLLEASAEERLFEIPLERMKEMGLVRSRGSQRTDSTHVLAQIRTLNRMELVGETLRQALNEVAILAPEWLSEWAPNEWFSRYITRIEEAKLPQDKSKRDKLIRTISKDGYYLLSKINEPNAPPYLLDSLAVQILRMVWIQHYYGPESKELWRTSEDVPPAHYMINSPYDPEAQYSRKRKITWVGYKVHLSESCDDDLPHLITNVETKPATEPDCVTLPAIHKNLDAKGLLPKEHLIDAGYTNIDNFVKSGQIQEIELVGPMRPDTSWQTREKTGYDISHFIVDWNTEIVTCPQGKTSTVWSPSTDKQGNDSITVRFPKSDCLTCCARSKCTRAKTDARALRFQPTQLYHESLLQARTYQFSEEFHERYRTRAGIEGTISQSIRSFEFRRSRFIGEAKAKLQNLAAATAINLSRLNQWWLGITPTGTRASAFFELKPVPIS